ncbi:MAG TPA: DUF2939 domain-containing protein [Candidatus Binataceae bacterium]|nr:DUF2939 domain-containing protein [Candidatus Binataceae bacterium]
MLRFALRHITAILIAIAVGWWAIFYLPSTPSWCVLQLKRAIDARDGDAACQYVDFQSVVKNAGQEMVKEKTGGDALSGLVGQAAIALFSQPMAAMLASWTKQHVNDGARDVQMPAAAVAGAVVLLHRDGDAAWTDFKDHKGQEWEIHMAREDGAWKITEVKNVRQLLERLEHSEEKRLAPP